MRSANRCRPALAPSRVNPLPQGPHQARGQRRTCGSGFTRERDGTGRTLMKTPPEKVAFLHLADDQ
ncbi:hypothetical protein E8E78_27715 [Pseudomonas sp. BN505]|nr:hypothetical protein [Pseudomonas sp. BN605]MDH4860339.1 hypothetical protein [Pseudomonas sp. BN505]